MSKNKNTYVWVIPVVPVSTTALAIAAGDGFAMLTLETLQTI